MTTCTCALCGAEFQGRGKSQPKGCVCPACMQKYGSAASGPVRVWRDELKRAEVRGLPATLSWNEWEQSKAHFCNMCAYCEHRPAKIIEHFIPLGQAGTTRGNCLPACFGCNRRKGGHLPENTPFSPLATESLRCYLFWREQGWHISGEWLPDKWQWILPPGWRRGFWEMWAHRRFMRFGNVEVNMSLKLSEYLRFSQFLQERTDDPPDEIFSLRLKVAIASDELARLIPQAEKQLTQEALDRFQLLAPGQWDTFRAASLNVRSFIEQHFPYPILLPGGGL